MMLGCRSCHNSKGGRETKHHAQLQPHWAWSGQSYEVAPRGATVWHMVSPVTIMTQGPRLRELLYKESNPRSSHGCLAKTPDETTPKQHYWLVLLAASG
jgi:hypothetical protein